MKTAVLCLALTVVSLCAEAQITFRGVDASPMDMAYFPDRFTNVRKDGETAKVRVTYSRPAKKDRPVFEKLAPYGKVWRLGANENTEIKFYQDATIQGKKIKAGTYSLFAIPNEKEWTLIFNSDLDYWGAFKYQEKNDVLRVTVPVKKAPSTIEHFSIQFAGEGNQGTMYLGWEDALVEVPMTF
ncbi:hypothetical protein GCM10027275_09570 [Rhabdobacter roseus]|uniref:DUF2911 domain-containing protein n=1 Tax=Rhabdobacter roseus TaxID=1655419 RepID=A0A840TSC2_9BACT|nr:DUF2911 domain-containing protein [Rhabdobacter roseus]MBB5282858.1 hypothetical protein [Rhabdobacter roseus]